MYRGLSDSPKRRQVIGRGPRFASVKLPITWVAERSVFRKRILERVFEEIRSENADMSSV